ncbi:putative mitochondrial protein AtMg00860 [Apium graveolens]|uniref:putative mitochondrial protein AtMg00860 n=1 Tax=Apium graveolens TaxID=4045 RepID=UPI003D7B1561
MQLVLATLEKHILVVNRKKYSFGVERVAYLGHVISGQGVAVDLDKVKSILDWPYLRTHKELRGFLGLTGYYRKYVWKYAQIAQPLTEQLKKDSFGWTSMEMITFDALK